MRLLCPRILCLPLVMATGRHLSKLKTCRLPALPNTGRHLTGDHLLLPNTVRLLSFLNTDHLLALRGRWLSLPNTGSLLAIRNTGSLLAINTGRHVPKNVRGALTGLESTAYGIATARHERVRSPAALISSRLFAEPFQTNRATQRRAANNGQVKAGPGTLLLSNLPCCSVICNLGGGAYLL